jgi:hypothetical protein
VLGFLESPVDGADSATARSLTYQFGAEMTQSRKIDQAIAQITRLHFLLETPFSDR